MFNSGLNAQQTVMNVELETKYPYGEKGSSAVRKARRQASEAERRFRIEKGYEKDTLWTWLKYRFLKR